MSVRSAISYPSIAWPRSSWWFTVLGALAGIAVILYPDTARLSIVNRIAVAAGLFILPAVLISVVFALRVVFVFCRRANAFEGLAGQIKALEEKLQSTHLVLGFLIQERENRHAYSVAYCYTYEDRTFIKLRKRRGPTLSEGQKVTVIDSRTSSVIGYFTITRQENEYYLCERDGYIDALWLGNIMQHGSQHSEAPPEALAIAIYEKRGDQHE